MLLFEQTADLQIVSLTCPGANGDTSAWIGADLDDLIDRPADVRSVRRFERRVLAEEQPARRVFTLQVDGVLRRIALSVDPVRTAGGSVRLRGVAVDLTEERRREQSFRQVSQRAEISRAIAEKARRTEESARQQAEVAHEAVARKEERRSTVLAGMAHDLRSPLSVIDGYVDLLKRTLTDAPADQLEHIHHAVDQLRSLVTSLTDLVRFETGTADVDVQPTDLRPVVEDLAGMFTHRARERSIDLQIDLPDDSVTARLDADGFRRVLSNLIDNALTYCDPGDAVRVRTDLIGEEAVEVEVSDSGPGIPPDARDDIFEPFRRGHDDAAGTGLGLAIARRLTEAMGGELRLSEPRIGGTTLTARFPAAASA
jgi:two-component system sensor histidine kinase KdpD